MALKLGKKQNRVKKIIKKASQTNVRAAGADSAVNSNLNLPTGRFTEGLGRRKVAIARVRLYESKGDFVVNGQLVTDYFAGVMNVVKLYNQPFEITNTKDKFAVTVKVSGSGLPAQLEAMVHGIARALVEYDPENRPLLKQAGLLTRDPRMKETRKPGRGGKARRKRQSPKR